MGQSKNIVMMNLTPLGQGQGGSLHQIALMRCFTEMGHAVRMLSPRRPESQRIPSDIRDRVTLTPAMKRIGLPAAFDTIVQIPALVACRVRARAETLYTRVNLFTWMVVGLGRILGMRVVVEHNSWCPGERQARGGGRFALALEKFSQMASANWAHVSRCVTPGIARLLEQHGVPGDKLVVIGNGVDTDVMRPLHRADSDSMETGGGVIRLGYMGGLVNWQGVEHAIQAMTHLQDIPSLELLIAGDGPERPALEALARRLGVTDRVRFLGYVPRDEAVKVINRFDIALAPFTRRRNEEIGLSPIKIRDYAAVGRIVVAARIDGIAELSPDGWLFTHRPDDPEDLANVVRQVLRRPAAERIDLGRRAREYAEAQFDWRQIAARVARYL